MALRGAAQLQGGMFTLAVWEQCMPGVALAMVAW